MKLGVNDLSSLEWRNRTALEDMEVQIQAGWRQEHHEGGGHTHITAESIEARYLTYIDVESGIRLLKGPLLLDDPALTGSNRHRAMLRWDPTTGTHHNVAINGITTARGMEIEPQGGNVTLTGMRPFRASFQKQQFQIRNRDTTYSVILKHENTGSYYNWRYDMPGGIDVTMGPGECFDLYYDPSRERWTAMITGTQTGGIMPGTGVASVLRAQMEITIDGGGSIISTGAKSVMTRVPWSFTPQGWALVEAGNVSTSSVVELWKGTYANYPPTNADAITGSDKPTISAAVKGTGSALTGWDTSWVEGEYVEAEVESNNNATKLVLTVYGTRST